MVLASRGASQPREAAAFQRRLDGQKLVDWTASFNMIRRLPMPTDAAEVAETQRLLGRAPRSYEAYVAERAAAWRAHDAAASP